MLRHASRARHRRPAGWRLDDCGSQRNLSVEAACRRSGWRTLAARSTADPGAVQPLVPLPGHRAAGFRQRRALAGFGLVLRRPQRRAGADAQLREALVALAPGEVQAW